MLICIAAVLNAGAFLYQVANPYLQADDWHYLHNVVRPWIEGTFHWRNLYFLRGPSDHALPVEKLIAVFSAEWFHLDDRVYSWIGFGCALMSMVLFWFRFRRAGGNTRNEWRLLAFSSLAVVYFSLNGLITYTWPLVTMGFADLLIVYVLFFVVDLYMTETRFNAWFCAAVALCALVLMDDIGVLGIACAIGITGGWACLNTDRQRALKLIGGLVLALISYESWRLGVVTYLLAGTGFSLGMKGLSVLLAEPARVIASLTKPMAYSVIHSMYLTEHGVPFPSWVQPAIGCFMILLHGFAWTVYLRRRLYAITLLPALLTGLCYLMLAGILVFRVPVVGATAWDFPRFVQMYQVGTIGVLWMLALHALTPSDGQPGKRSMPVIIGLVLLAVALTSTYADTRSWPRTDYLRHYEKAYGKFMLRAAAGRNKGCPAVFTICRLTAAEWKSSLKFLQAHELSVFAPGLNPESVFPADMKKPKRHRRKSRHRR